MRRIRFPTELNGGMIVVNVVWQEATLLTIAAFRFHDGRVRYEFVEARWGNVSKPHPSRRRTRPIRDKPQYRGLVGPKRDKVLPLSPAHCTLIYDASKSPPRSSKRWPICTP